MLSAVALAVGFLLVQLASFGAFAAAGGELDLDGRLGAGPALLLAAFQVVSIAVGALVVFAASDLDWRTVGLGRQPRGSFAEGWQLLLPIGLLLIGPTVGAALATDTSLVHSSVSLGDAVAFALLAAAIGLNEELWFRGLVVTRLAGAARPVLAVVTASLIFGLLHVGDTRASILNATAVTVAVAVPFTIVRLRRPSLWPLVAWHAVIDVWAFVHTASVVATGEPDLADAVATMALPVAIGAGYVWWYRRDVARERSLTP